MDGSAKPWDCLFKNALVFDGRGAIPVPQDLAVRAGRIVAMAPGLEVTDAQQVVDVRGRWLMPGLLDIHTHFDLEVEIEPQLPEAVRHGTTTVVVANCSLGLAYGAQRRNGEDPIVDCFARVENVPKPVLRKVADKVYWSDSRAYLEHLQQLPLGPNIVPMIPHSMLRIEVMGLKDSVSREPTAAELAQMEALVEKGMQEGYVGFSTDALPFHFLANAPNTHKQIPTQFAPFHELKRLTSILRRWDRVWQATPPKDDKLAVFRNFLLTSGRLYGRALKVTAVAAIDITTNKSIVRLGLLLSRLLNSQFLRGRFRLQALAAPFKIWSDGVITPIAEEIPVLRQLNERDLEDRAGRAQIMASSQWQQAFRAMWFRGRRGFDLARLKNWLGQDDNVLTRNLADMTIEQCPVPAWSGETLADIHQRLQRWQRSGEGARDELEREAFASFANPIADDCDFLIHLLRRYDTDLRWWTVTANRNPEMTRALLFNPLLLPGFNDSGAHLTNMAFYDGNLRMLKIAQQDGVAQVARAVHRLTQEPAEFFGIDCGVLQLGAQADLVVIDPDALRRFDPDRSVEYHYREVFEHHQLVNRPQGVVTEVMVGGKLAWSGGRYTPLFGRERFGRVLLDASHERERAQQALVA